MRQDVGGRGKNTATSDYGQCDLPAASRRGNNLGKSRRGRLLAKREKAWMEPRRECFLWTTESGKFFYTSGLGKDAVCKRKKRMPKGGGKQKYPGICHYIGSILVASEEGS